MSMYNLIESSSSHFETTGSLWIYSKDEATNLIMLMVIILNFPNIRLNY